MQLQHTAIGAHCHTLQHTQASCWHARYKSNTLQLQRSATHTTSYCNCNTLQHTQASCWRARWKRNALQLQHTSQHTATAKCCNTHRHCAGAQDLKATHYNCNTLQLQHTQASCWRARLKWRGQLSRRQRRRQRRQRRRPKSKTKISHELNASYE